MEQLTDKDKRKLGKEQVDHLKNKDQSLQKTRKLIAFTKAVVNHEAYGNEK